MQAPPTFDDADELLHVVVCLPVVNHRSNREDQLGLDLREPVENTLQQRPTAERRLKTRDTEQLEEDSRRSERRMAGSGHLHRWSFELLKSTDAVAENVS